MKTLNLFISFSSKDQEYVRELMSGLKTQGIDFWDYSDMIQAIEVGVEIPNALKEKIDQCEYFLSIISENSVDATIGKYTYLELEYALAIQLLEKNKIIPIVISENKPNKWLGPYDALKNIRYVEFQLRDSKSLIHSIAQLCIRFDVIYRPVFEEHPKLPFWKFFRDEVLTLAQPNNTYINLMTLISEFIDKIKMDSWNEAHFLITYFIYACKYQIPDYKIFYPWIVKAVCEQQLNLLNEAEKSYLEADRVRPRNENVYGGLGSVAAQKKDWLKAKEYFKKSLDYCPVNENSEEQINYIISKINLGRKIPEDMQNLILTLNPDLFSEEMQVNIWHARAAIFYNSANYEAVVDICDQLFRSRNFNTVSLSYFYLSLIKLNDLTWATQLLESVAKDINLMQQIDPGTFYHHRADLSLRNGETGSALKIYREHLMQDSMRTRQFVIKYARLLKNIGETRTQREICLNLINGLYFPLPKTEEDFYYDGFAQFLLGNIDKSNYDYERSHQFDTHYSAFEY